MDRMDKQRNFIRETKALKKTQREILEQKYISETKNVMNKVKSRLEQTKFSELEDKVTENSQSEIQKGKRIKILNSVRNMWVNIK